MSGVDEFRRRLGFPEKQDNLARAMKLAFTAVADQPDGQLIWLGAERSGGAWRLPVFNDAFHVDLSAARITTSAGQEVGPHWSILGLHYLGVTGRPERCRPAITFADLAHARAYADVYQRRVISRLCATAGRNAETLSAAARSLGGRRAQDGDLAFDFDLFPRISVRLVWYAPDEEFPPSATLLLPENIEAYFCSEDIVVLSERLVSRLGGRPF